jgi:hypothetical protein
LKDRLAKESGQKKANSQVKKQGIVSPNATGSRVRGGDGVEQDGVANIAGWSGETMPKKPPTGS